MWNLKKLKQMNQFAGLKQTHRHRKKNLWLQKGKGGGGEDGLGV